MARKNKKKYIRLQVYFVLIVLAEVLATIILSIGVRLIFQKLFHYNSEIPQSLSIVACSFLIGFGFYKFVDHFIFEDIRRLRTSMRDVMTGDFTVRAETKGRINEINELCESFNQMVAELRSMDTLQSDFVSSVSHEFKTPINAIEGYSTLLQEDALNEEQALYVDKIILNTKRLSELVGNVLLLSKVENTSINEKKEEYRLDEQIRQSILYFEEKWTKKEIEFDVEMDSISFVACRNLLLHVWNNLIDNAIKFSPQGATIAIRLMQTENGIDFRISDHGPGIPKAEQLHVFHKFYQSDSSHKSEGYGLGLPLCKQIVELHNGTIMLDSDYTDGCCFVVTLPAHFKS